MSCWISRLLCFTSTQKQPTWYINWIRSEHYWCEGHSGRCWRSKFERRIGILRTFLDRYWNGEWTTQSLQLCHVILQLFLLNDKLDYLFKELKCAANENLAFGFVLKNVEDGSCKYFYAHENNTVMDSPKLVCTPTDTINLKHRMQKMDIVDICTRDRANTKW